MGIIFIIGVVQAFFIEFILLTKRRKSLPDKILAIWIFILGLHLFLYYLDYTGFYQSYPHLQGLMVPLPLVHGPLMLVYLTSLINKNQTINRLLWLNFIPTFLFYLYLVPRLLLTKQGLLYWIQGAELDPPIIFLIFSISIDISGPVYILWSLLLLRRHRKGIGENFSFTEKINLNWLRNIIVGMAIIWSVVLIANLMDSKTGPTLVYAAVTLFVFLIGYYGIRQGVIFTDARGPEEKADPIHKPKYEKSALKEDQAGKYYQDLLEHMKDNKPYLESKITLPQLAGEMKLNPNYVSQVINDSFGQNFYDFINSYRVEEFKRRLNTKTAPNYTLLAHGLDSGFSSKSSFNEVFKKFTSQTPSQYFRNLRATGEQSDLE